MSFVLGTVARRAYSTRSYIPPNLGAAVKSATPKAETGSNDLSGLVEFYKRIPKGAANSTKPRGLLARYRAKYWEGDNASFTPFIHAMLLVGAIHIGLHYKHHQDTHAHGEHH
ncbi:hypothetical protein K493DRAFT_274745 [Basidiobolus meristosporus CBS 931.73]|uniref:Uncharacterized protein n=1 Tax=Basidiobolus meristosporus CBS 931.73 TaxID=1314790 RepID=A0A1Y1Z7A2_9FUNG|nr:hypothetical protein K493DRAFT_274745 [Basidiobolus meristosporus CBS 931.73]|eukprot:ORY05877.1 hypothetical protein K493DRAFT_274745 [Basidiobolus meristosporus CBS 931.73]